jgi:hypothetical protein
MRNDDVQRRLPEPVSEPWKKKKGARLAEIIDRVNNLFEGAHRR